MFNAGTPAKMQTSIRHAKGRQAQTRWIVITVDDHFYHLDAIQVDFQGILCTVDSCQVDGWLMFWQSLAKLELDRYKWWLVGFDVRNALNRADMLKALEAGEVRLPESHDERGEKKRPGKFTVSQRCLEIDIVCGKNKIKLLDWTNFGVMPGHFAATLRDITPEIARQTLDDYLTMCKSVGLVPAKATMAQIGWAKCKRDHLPAVLACNLDDEARALERRAHIGGRNEPFRLGKIPGTTFSLDIKSCYASICEQCTLPVYLEREYRDGCDLAEIDAEGDHHWIADVVLSTPAADYPLRWMGEPIYPIGVFSTSLCWPELCHAMKHGRVVKILRAAKYLASPALASYALWFEKAKHRLLDAGLTQMRQALKGTFNASLGFTARQKYNYLPWDTEAGQQWLIGHTTSPDDHASLVPARILDGTKEWLRVGGEPREAMPFLHATICSWARVRLLAIMDWAGRHNVHYVDTDGLLVSYEGYANLLDSPGVMGESAGQLDERFPPGPARINGQKDYQLGSNVVCAGLIRANHGRWSQKPALTTPTGNVDHDGIVRPHEFRCEDRGDESAKWTNELEYDPR